MHKQQKNLVHRPTKKKEYPIILYDIDADVYQRLKKIYLLHGA